MKFFRCVHSCFDRLYRHWFGRLLFSLIMVGGVFLFALWRVEPAYLLNDDTNIAFALAGYRTGAPFGAHPFINILLSIPISRLYSRFPAVPWWFMLQEAALFLSGIALSMSTLRVCAKRNVHWLLACMLFGVLFVGLLFRPIVRVTFTLTAAALGAASVALVLSFDRDDAKWQKTLLSVASGLFLAFSFLFRNSSGISVACFYFAAVAYRVLDAHFYGRAARLQLKRRAYALGIVMLLLVGALIGANQIGISICNEEGYASFDEARANFVDYRLCDPYSENPALYASVDWDEPLYALAMHWCFMDERVTTEAFETLAASSASATLPLSERLSRVPARVQEFLENDYFARLMLTLPAAAFCASIVLLCLTKRRNWLAFAACFCMLLGAVLLLGYLAYCDRIILRTFRLVLMPACFAASLLAVRILPTSQKSTPDACVFASGPTASDAPTAATENEVLAQGNGENPPEPLPGTGAVQDASITPDASAIPDSAAATAQRTPSVWRGIVSVVLCTLLLLAAGLTSGRALADTLRSDYSDEIALCRAVIDYCIAHPGTIFIRDTATCSNLDAVTAYPGKKPVNLLSWGDTDMLTGVQKAQLDLLGLSAPLRMDAFRQQNVRYIGTVDSGAYRAFAAYLAAQGAQLVEMDQATDGVFVYRVVFQEGAA